MKSNIHPKVNMETVVTCACGNKFTTISTLPAISVEICSACHPFFTGNEKVVDTAGMVEKFRGRASKATAPKKKDKPSSAKATKGE